MCLRLISKKKKAKEDIVCFKVLKKEYFPIRLITPFRDFPMEIGKTYTEKKRVSYIKYRKIGGGVFHAYTNLAIALQTLREWEWKSAVIVKCIIPKGSYYYEGSDEDIAGKTIVIQQQIDEELLDELIFYSLYIKNVRLYHNLTENQAKEMKWNLAVKYDEKELTIVKQDKWI